MLEKAQPLLISNAAEDPRFLAGNYSAGRKALPVVCRNAADHERTTGSGHAGTAGNQARPIQAGTFNTAGDIGTPGGDAPGGLYSRIRLQEQAQRSRQRTERALAIERCFVAATLDSIPALVAVLDTAGRLVRMNQPCERLTWAGPGRRGGPSVYGGGAEGRGSGLGFEQAARRCGGRESGPHRRSARFAGEPGFDTEGRKTRRVSWTLRPLKGPNGEIQYVIVSGQDVTDRGRWRRHCFRASSATGRWWKTRLALSLPAQWKAGLLL